MKHPLNIAILIAILFCSDWHSHSMYAEEPASDPAALVGKQVEGLALRDFRGRHWSWQVDFADKRLVVVTFMGTECPLVKLYSHRLVQLQEKYADQDVAFVGINSNQQDSMSEIAQFVREHKIDFPMLKDVANQTADQFGAQRTPEIFVLDTERVVCFHGSLDNEFHYGAQRSSPSENYLVDAIEDLLAGRAVKVPSSEIVGCRIGRVLEPQADSKVTYSNQIVRILQKRCVECHRSQEIAPFELTQYDEVVGWAEMIEEVVRDERMPPWSASAEHGSFRNDARLSDEEKQLIYDWVGAGAPLGDPAELPAAAEFVEGWRMGQPDLVVEMARKPFQVPATGEVRYQYFRVDPGFNEDMWIQSAECRPGNRAVVHHIIVGIEGDRKRNRGEFASEWLSATAPGAEPLMLPDGYAKLIPAGSKLVFQMHYTPNGTAQEDLSKVGFKFVSADKVKYQVLTQQASNHRFEIPANTANHPVDANYIFQQPAELLSLFPHMHLRGSSFQYTAVYPDGKREILLDVPKYDFNWQIGYQLSAAKQIPAGTRIECKATFDNSADNFANPDPNQKVRWGDQTWEEMMIGYFDIAIERK